MFTYEGTLHKIPDSAHALITTGGNDGRVTRVKTDWPRNTNIIFYAGALVARRVSKYLDRMVAMGGCKELAVMRNINRANGTSSSDGTP